MQLREEKTIKITRKIKKFKYELKNNSGKKWEKMQLRGEEKPTRKLIIFKI
jgi:hypothetical protein